MYNEGSGRSHIAKVLKMLICYVPGIDSHQLRMKVFPFSLADDAKEWWISEGDGKITTWEELVKKLFCRFYPESYDGEDENVIFHSWMNRNWNKRYVDNSILSNNEWKESKYENPSNTATDSFFKAYDVSDIEKRNGQGQMKRKDNDKDDKRPHKKICKTEKFKAKKYLLGPNEEYLAIRRCEYDIWERNKDSVSQIYQEIFQKKDDGWRITRME
ncbi:hypothetical protein Tco_0017719 [Tanacetum coccineum]